jgi:hypothetical protein
LFVVLRQETKNWVILLRVKLRRTKEWAKAEILLRLLEANYEGLKNEAGILLRPPNVDYEGLVGRSCFVKTTQDLMGESVYGILISPKEEIKKSKKC